MVVNSDRRGLCFTRIHVSSLMSGRGQGDRERIYDLLQRNVSETRRSHHRDGVLFLEPGRLQGTRRTGVYELKGTPAVSWNEVDRARTFYEVG